METQSHRAGRAQSVSAQRARTDQTRTRSLAPRAHHEMQACVRQHEVQARGLVVDHKVDLVWLALRLFLEVRISFRAVSRVLQLLAAGCGITKAPCPQTVINWVTRLAIVRCDAARRLRGLPLSAAPFSNGLIWMIDISIGLGIGKILAVVAVDAQHHALA